MSFLWFYEYEEIIYEIHSEEIRNVLNTRRRLRDRSNPLEMDEVLFKTNYRLSKEVFINLLNEIDNKIKTSSIPNIIKLACLLRFCAQGSYQMSIANDYQIVLGRSTVSEVLTELLQIIEHNICPKWVKFNYSEEEINYFYTRSGLPGIIGCIDGTHVKIRCPSKNLQHLYYNRKGYFSINAMIVCNHKMAIKYVNARYPGSSHDSMVWNMSRLKEILQEKYDNGMRDLRLLGDAGYPLLPYLITLFRNTELHSRESHFNRQHSKARVIIENTIGLLKTRFRCLLGARELHFQPEKVTRIINVCAALHNICLHHNIELDPEDERVRQEIDNDEIAENQNVEGNTAGETIRNRLLELLM